MSPEIPARSTIASRRSSPLVRAPSAPQLESPCLARLGKRRHVAVTANEWKTSERVDHYLELVDTVPHLAEGESVLLEQLPSGACRILDLGTGDGRLLAHVLRERPESVAVAIDVSERMLERARERFADQPVDVCHHDLAEPLPDLGRFDGVVSGLAIHHLEDERKRMLYAEILDLLEPGGVFANFEHVASPTPRLHRRFFEAIGEPLECEDPSDRLVDVETQLRWLRDIGFGDVDCYWKWLELALLVGVKPEG